MTSVRYRTYTKAAAKPSARPVRALGTVGNDRVRRILNIVVAAIGLVVTAPVMVVIAIRIKMTSHGRVIFSQTRVGIDRRHNGVDGENRRRLVDYGGKPFTIYKFRTMYDNDGNPEDEVWASPWDPRITLFGRRLRKYRLDELPQLINVLRGDMNLVGPRPEQPRIFQGLRGQIGGYQNRQQVLPGITGWAQVRYHYDSSVDDVQRKVELDLKYIAKRSAIQDLKIMFMTVPVVLLKKGAW